MTAKQPTLPPGNLKRPTPPTFPKTMVKHEHNHVHTTIEEARMDFQIEFTFYGSEDKFVIDPRDITMVSSFGTKAVIYHCGKETMVEESYENCRSRVREARVAILNYNRTEETNREIAREHADGKFARTPVPHNSKWSF